MKTIFILMDSLNRHYLNAYGNPWIQTPNIDRLAAKGLVFDRHFAGSLPCMPARRELMTGRLNFLETPWCPLQPFDETLPDELRKQTRTYSHMITDHYHYFEWNGMGYHTPFDSWEFSRGQESDHWRPSVAEPETPPFRGRNKRPNWVNRSFMDTESDEAYSTPQCFKQAIEFLQTNHDQDNWHLHLELFDPHEPFQCPSKYLDLYEDAWDGRYLFDWPDYKPVDPHEEGPDAIAHIRKRYAAVLTMADHWLGKLLDEMDRLHLWEDTAVVLTTDHGYLIGEHGYWAKNYMFDYTEITHIPLIIYTPQAENGGRRVQALTSTIDLMPTFLELHGAKPSGHVHGKSLLHLIGGDELHHDAVLYGYFGKDINLTDGRYTYCRQPSEGSIVHHHTAMPIGARYEREIYAQAEVGRFLKQADMPVYRIPVRSRRHHEAPDDHPLYDIVSDPFQQQPIHDWELEARYEAKIRELLNRYDAPECQFTRMFDGRGSS